MAVRLVLTHVKLMQMGDIEQALNALIDTQDILLEGVKEIELTLKRIEERQVKTTAMVKDVQVHEAPVTGSFGSVEKKDG